MKIDFNSYDFDKSITLFLRKIMSEKIWSRKKVIYEKLNNEGYKLKK